jgi:hypothetical protein
VLPNGSSRKMVVWALVALVAAMVADLIESVIDPANSGEGAKIVAASIEHHDRMVISAFMLLASAAFIVPGVWGLASLIEARGRRIGRAAMVLALLGSLGHAALGGIYLVWSAMPAQTGRQTELIAAIDRTSDAASLAPLFVLFIAFPVSLVVFFIATARAGLAPRWIVVPALAAPASAIAAIGPEPAPTATALVFLLVASCVLAVSLLGRPGTAMSEPRSAPVTA